MLERVLIRLLPAVYPILKCDPFQADTVLSSRFHGKQKINNEIESGSTEKYQTTLF